MIPIAMAKTLLSERRTTKNPRGATKRVLRREAPMEPRMGVRNVIETTNREKRVKRVARVKITFTKRRELESSLWEGVCCGINEVLEGGVDGVPSRERGVDGVPSRER